MAALARDCPSEDVVAAFLERRLSHGDTLEVERHVDECTSCRRLLSELARGSKVTTTGSVTVGEGGLLAAGTLLHRYVVLELVGRGGMGVVYAAYDPELDRKIAIKVLHGGAGVDAETEVSRSRARLLREARAMAQVVHPNVVNVLDVGPLPGSDGAVFIAMEFVDGQTVADWLAETPRPWPEVIDVFVAAGRGLEAVHARGLVHRDVKPANLLVGKDGRVRIMDFGLVDHTRESGVEGDGEITLASSVGAGTPAYMAPEQLLGLALDARADQFAFCIALFEALWGMRPFAGASLSELAQAVLSGRIRDPLPARGVPGWLERVVRRGLARDPVDRYPSMAALLGALGRNPTRARRRWAALASGAALGLGALGWAGIERSRATAACEAAGASIAEVWSDRRRDEVGRAVLASGAPYAASTWERVVPWLDEYAASWQSLRTNACTSFAADDPREADVRARAEACLDESRLRLAGVVDALAQADATVVRNAVPAAATLPPLSRCLDEAWLVERRRPADEAMRTAVDALAGDFARTHSLLGTGRYAEAFESARTLIDDAQAVGWAPAVARAQALAGVVAEAAGDYRDAEARLRDAYFAASRADDDDVAAEAATQLVNVVGDRLGRVDEGLAWVEHASVALERAGEQAHGLRDALLRHNQGRTQVRLGDYAGARASYEAALAVFERELGADHPRVASAHNNLGLALRFQGELDEAIVESGRALAGFERALGPDHPDVGLALENLGITHASRGEYPHATAYLHAAVVLDQTALGSNHPAVARVLDSLGNVYGQMGEYDRAVEHHRRALTLREATLGPDHVDVAGSLNNLGLDEHSRKRHAAALAYHERALAIREAALGGEHPAVGMSLVNLCLLEVEMGRHAEARDRCPRAYEVMQHAHGSDHPMVSHALIALGMSHHAVGELDAALEAYARVLESRERTLGPEHPDVATVLHEIGQIHLARRETKRALELLERAAVIGERAFGADSITLANLLLDLGDARLATGHADTAEAALERTLALVDRGATGVEVERARKLLARARAAASGG